MTGARAPGGYTDVDLKIRTATREKSMRITWPDQTLVELNFMSKGARKSQVAIQHSRLPDKAAASNMKEFWAARLAALQGVLGAVPLTRSRPA